MDNTDYKNMEKGRPAAGPFHPAMTASDDGSDRFFALDEKGSLLARMVKRMPGGVGILHAEGNGFVLDYANDGWFDIHEISCEEGRKLLHGDIAHVIYGPDRKHLIDVYDRICGDDDQEGQLAYRIHGGKGAIHWIKVRFRFILEQAGIRYYCATYTNIDREKEAENRLIESRQALQEAISYSDVQYFTYYPDRHLAVIDVMNTKFSGIPNRWEDFPRDFMEYGNIVGEDAQAYRDMVSAMDGGADRAGCVIRLCFHGIYYWQKVTMIAIRDNGGKTVRVACNAIDITARKKAGERLEQEKTRARSLEGNMIEAFSFNLTQNAQPDIQTLDKAMLEGTVDVQLLKEAQAISPALSTTNPETREVLLRAAARIPSAKDRELFIATCSGSAVRRGISEGRYSASIRYRRRVGDRVKWVSTDAEVLPDPETGDFMAFFYTRDINDEVITEKLTNHVIMKNYAAVSFWDRQTGLFSVRRGHDTAMGLIDGLPYPDTLAVSAEHCVSDDERALFLERFDPERVLAVLENQTIYTIYAAFLDPDGREHRMKNDLFFLDENKEIVVFLLSDVTAVFEEERLNREKMAQALAAAEQASVAKTEFLSRMSHEIRTPMNAIIGLDAIALQEEGLSASMEDHLQKIGISARFLLSLINDILDMSRIESGRMVLRSEPFNFKELIDGINTILYEQCRESGLEYECILKSMTEDTYVGDVTKLQQVLVNILGNAVKFTPRGGKILFTIEQLRRGVRRARLRFEVSDTGIGIDDDFLPHLFEPFSQENRGRTSEYGGTGLGLAISRNIVSLMGGEITVHSIKNIGTGFTVEVDLGLSPDAVARRALFDPKLKPLKTLIVDDDVVVCQHTQMILKEAGMKAEWVSSGMDAVETVTEAHSHHRDYELVLLDWQMPDMDGIATARELRKVVGPEVTIIIMTAYDWANIEKQALAAGVNCFLRKPLFASTVVETVENILLNRPLDDDGPEPPAYDFSGRRVLLAEDNGINAEIARNILQVKHCQVETAANGVEAVESFAAAPAGYFDAILMDIRMPVMDGLEATKTIRAMRKTDSRTIPIIAMTANAFQEDVNQSLASGMDVHLSKPIEPPLLYGTLARLFES